MGLDTKRRALLNIHSVNNLSMSRHVVSDMKMTTVVGSVFVFSPYSSTIHVSFYIDKIIMETGLNYKFHVYSNFKLIFSFVRLTY